MTVASQTKRPEDFDRFWDRMVGRCMQTPVRYRMEPAEFPSAGAECFDLYFQSMDGEWIHALYLRLRTPPVQKRPALLMFHGYTWNSGGFASKLQYTDLGFSVLAMDCRGQSGKTPDTARAAGNTVFGHILRGIEGAVEEMHYTRVFLDTVMLARVAADLPEVDPQRICTLGDSQGGALSLVCAALAPGIRRVACYYPFLCDYRMALSLPGPTAYDELNQYFRRADPLHEHAEELFEKLDYIDVTNFTPRISCRVLWFQGGMDDCCPVPTQQRAYEQLSGPKQKLLYPEYGHEIMPDSLDRVYTFFYHFCMEEL